MADTVAGAVADTVAGVVGAVTRVAGVVAPWLRGPWHLTASLSTITALSWSEYPDQDKVYHIHYEEVKCHTICLV